MEPILFLICVGVYIKLQNSINSVSEELRNVRYDIENVRYDIEKLKQNKK